MSVEFGERPRNSVPISRCISDAEIVFTIPTPYSLLYPYRIMRKHLLLFALGILLFLTAAWASTQNRGAATAPAASADWPTFGGDNTRTNANMAPTHITAANVGSMVRQQVTISGPIDAA
jgi:hypothetical protein